MCSNAIGVTWAIMTGAGCVSEMLVSEKNDHYSWISTLQKRLWTSPLHAWRC